MLNQINCEDCVTGMGKLPASSIQLVVTSPPYNVQKPYTVYNDNLEYAEYLKFMKEVFTECYRILKKEGVCFVNIQNCKDNQFKAYDLAYLLRDIGFSLIDTIIWYKPNPRYLNTNRMLTNSYEFIFMFAKSQKYVFDKLKIGIPCKTQSGLKCRGNVWIFDKIFKNQYSNFQHCAMFPEMLPELCIRVCSKRGDVVVDPFMGAGTTAVTAKKLGRNYIGFEISPQYTQMAKSRLKNTQEVEYEKSKDISDNGVSIGPVNAFSNRSGL